MRLPGATGYNFMGEPVRITWPLQSCSPNCASRPANQRSDSMGQVSDAASSTVPTTTSLIRMLRLCAQVRQARATCLRFRKHESRVHAVARDQPLTRRPGRREGHSGATRSPETPRRWPPDTLPPKGAHWASPWIAAPPPLPPPPGWHSVPKRDARQKDNIPCRRACRRSARRRPTAAWMGLLVQPTL